MLTRKTVIVVGAGASNELGLPLGADLRQKISNLLNITFPDGTNQRTGDKVIASSLRQISQTPSAANIDELIQKCLLIRDALPAAISIDNLLDAHRKDSDVALIGKLGIAQAILNAERSSKLHKVLQADRQSSLYSLADTWLLPMFQLLTEGVIKEKADTIFDNVTFIVFNYDRCLEVFLNIALKAYYGFNEHQSAEIASTAKIIHPYGRVGDFGASSSLATVSFGAKQCGLRQVAEGIRTFSEGVCFDGDHKLIKDAVTKAEQIVFLGFAFHPLNMEILRVDQPSNISKVFGTTLGLSDAAVRSVKYIIRTTLKKMPSMYEVNPLNMPEFSEVNLEQRNAGDFLFAHFRGLT